jgi:hypothetical protein
MQTENRLSITPVMTDESVPPEEEDDDVEPLENVEVGRIGNQKNYEHDTQRRCHKADRVLRPHEGGSGLLWGLRLALAACPFCHQLGGSHLGRILAPLDVF